MVGHQTNIRAHAHCDRPFTHAVGQKWLAKKNVAVLFLRAQFFLTILRLSRRTNCQESESFKSLEERVRARTPNVELVMLQPGMR